MYLMYLARRRKRKNGIVKIRNKAKRDSKYILELFKQLYKQISNHLELLEPKGVHLLEKEERVKMEGMKKNYKFYSKIEEEIKNVVLDNFLAHGTHEGKVS